MLALRVHGFEGKHQWALEEASVPEPMPDQVQVRIIANAISFVDLLFARGGYQVKPALPVTPGTEFSGVVTGVGKGVDKLRIGQRVTGMTVGGAWAELACAPAASVQALPDELDPHGASPLAVTYATALYALRQRGGLKAGETVLVLGAAGGVGLASVQVARALGATVLAGASSEVKLSSAIKEGAHHAIDLSQTDWRSAVKAAAPAGVDVVVDTLGDIYTETAFRTLRWGGRHLVIGFAGGEIPAVRSNLPLLKGSALIGVDIRQFREFEPEASRMNLAETISMYASGALRPRLAGIYPIRDWAKAISHAENPETVGRVVLSWPQL